MGKDNFTRGKPRGESKRPRRTTCSKGHEYTEENTYVTRRGRACIKCKKNRRLALAYGITIEDKDLILKLQGNKCGICGVDLEGVKQCLDHCHDTNAIRGVLCNQCNTAEGHIRATGLDPKEWAKRLKSYLEKPSIPLLGVA